MIIDLELSVQIQFVVEKFFKPLDTAIGHCVLGPFRIDKRKIGHSPAQK